MITVKYLDPEKGDQQVILEPMDAADLILSHKRKGLVGFVKFDDESLLELPDAGTTLELMERTGILEQLEARDGSALRIVPIVGGG